MREDTKAALDSLFDQHAEAQRRAQEIKEAKESAEDAFLREFLAVRSSIIEPALKEIGEHLKSKGCDYSIESVADGSQTRQGNPEIEASITLTFRPPGKATSRSRPHLGVHCRKREKKVLFHESTMTDGGGHTRSVGEVFLPDVTADLVQRKVMEVVAQVLRP